MRVEAMIRGWCPDAWRPMAAGDGLLLRVRPPLGRMTVPQVRALCAASRAYGNGLIDLTNRAALQLRGAREADWRRLVADLVEAGLVRADPVVEARPGLVVDPAWQIGDDVHRIATDLLARLAALPDLPAKMGFAIDAGPSALLGAVPADFRIERADDDGLMLRLDGRDTGMPLRPGEEVSALIDLAQWFVASGGARAGRAARHRARLPDWAEGLSRPARLGTRWHPGEHKLGAVYGLPFGQIDADVFMALVDRPGATGLRLTPWRLLLVEGVDSLPVDGLVSDPMSPLLQIDACVGAPACPQASVETRAVARRLAPLLGARALHVSGCAKGCAHPRASAVVLTGRDGRFDLGFDARAGDAPTETGLTPHHLPARLGDR